MTLSALPELLKTTWSEFNEDKAPRLGAALAYYTTFSLAPLLVVVIGIAGLFLGQKAAEGQIVGTIGGLIGETGAAGIQTMIQGASKPSTGIVGTIVGLVTLLLGASGVFGALQDALNTIWEVAPKPGRGIMGMIRDRFFSFTLVLGTGFMLLVSQVLTTLLAAFGKWLSSTLPGGDVFWMVVNFIFGFAIISLLFALIFKIIPDVEIAWRDVGVGAVVTAFLFSIGRIALGFYLGRTDYTSAYGAAGSLVIILLWMYYSAQILFLGAEFTQVYANKYGSRVVPSTSAVPLTEQARLQQGMPRAEDVKQAAAPDNDIASVEAAAQQRDTDGRDPERRTQDADEVPAPATAKPVASLLPARIPRAAAVAQIEGSEEPSDKSWLKAVAISAFLLGVTNVARQLGRKLHKRADAA